MVDFPLLPPEINSTRMYSGAGSGPLFMVAAAWDGLAAGLQGSASSFDSVITGLASGPWVGPASVAMAAAATRYAGWLNAAAGQAALAAGQARVAATAFEMAFAATVASGGGDGEPHVVGDVNRDELFGSEHSGYSSHGVSLCGNVGSGCGRDGWLSRRGALGGCDIAAV
jgi:hypothetical protein